MTLLRSPGERHDHAANPFGELIAAQPPVCYTKHRVHSFGLGGLNLAAVQDQEDVGSNESDPLVPVEKSVVLRQAKAVPGSE